jgi:hypothetical protein
MLIILYYVATRNIMVKKGGVVFVKALYPLTSKFHNNNVILA